MVLQQEQARKATAAVEVEVKAMDMMEVLFFKNMILRGCLNNSANPFGHSEGRAS